MSCCFKAISQVCKNVASGVFFFIFLGFLGFLWSIVGPEIQLGSIFYSYSTSQLFLSFLCHRSHRFMTFLRREREGKRVRWIISYELVDVSLSHSTIYHGNVLSGRFLICKGVARARWHTNNVDVTSPFNMM